MVKVPDPRGVVYSIAPVHDFDAGTDCAQDNVIAGFEECPEKGFERTTLGSTNFSAVISLHIIPTPVAQETSAPFLSASKVIQQWIQLISGGLLGSL